MPTEPATPGMLCETDYPLVVLVTAGAAGCGLTLGLRVVRRKNRLAQSDGR